MCYQLNMLLQSLSVKTLSVHWESDGLVVEHQTPDGGVLDSKPTHLG